MLRAVDDKAKLTLSEELRKVLVSHALRNLCEGLISDRLGTLQKSV